MKLTKTDVYSIYRHLKLNELRPDHFDISLEEFHRADKITISDGDDFYVMKDKHGKIGYVVESLREPILSSRSPSNPPPRKEGWEHSDQVLVLYKGNPNYVEAYGIAYFHYNPPFKSSPEWVDVSGNHHGRMPFEWWPLPLSNTP